jgi:DNA-binding NarL/FixJ family response regulator
VTLRLVLVDDHPALIRGLESLIESEDYSVVGCADTAAGLAQIVHTVRPDIVVSDLSMPGDVFAAIRSASRDGARVLVFTAYAEVGLALRAFEAGASAFVLKGRPAADLFDALRALEKGEVFVSPDVAPKILGALRQRGEKGGRPASVLSIRERQIVDGLLRAKTNKEIARELNLSEKTIKHYMTNLMAKLGAKNRLDVVLAMQPATPMDRVLREPLDALPRQAASGT